MDQPGKVANPARRQLNRENYISLSAFAPENLVSRDGFDSPVPRQPAHLHTQAENLGFLPSSAAASNYLLIFINSCLRRYSTNSTTGIK